MALRFQLPQKLLHLRHWELVLALFLVGELARGQLALQLHHQQVELVLGLRVVEFLGQD